MRLPEGTPASAACSWGSCPAAAQAGPSSGIEGGLQYAMLADELLRNSNQPRIEQCSHTNDVAEKNWKM